MKRAIAYLNTVSQDIASPYLSYIELGGYSVYQVEVIALEPIYPPNREVTTEIVKIRPGDRVRVHVIDEPPHHDRERAIDRGCPR